MLALDENITQSTSSKARNKKIKAKIALIKRNLRNLIID
tara:strand:- start:1310 stop:1426 length:117 start_codon:yes stop_codon:yes gene_type:complete